MTETRGICDRCGADVQAHEDCTILEEVRFAIQLGWRPFCGFTVGRHIACSPSRMQALAGDDATWREAKQILEAAARDFREDVETYSDAVKRHMADACGNPDLTFVRSDGVMS